ncbi:MAG: tetratricopeptide repeat protein [Desulfomonilaceae bacterium]
MIRTFLSSMIIMACAAISSPLWSADNQQALELYNKAYAIYQKAQSRRDSQEAGLLFEKALLLYRQSGDKKGEARCLNKIGEICDDWGEYDRALNFYEQALSIWQALGDLQGQGLALNNIGLIYYHKGDYTKALEYWKKCLEIRRNIRHAAGEAVTLNNIAGVYQRLGKYADALERYRQAQEIQQRLKNERGEAITLNNIGEVYRAMGDYPKALESYQASLQIKRKLGNVADEAATLSNIGLVHNAKGEYRQALEYYEKALPIFEKMGDVRGESSTLNNIAAVYQNTGDYTKALQYYERCLATSRRLGDAHTESNALNNIASVYDAKGEYHQAMAFYEKSLQLKKGIGDVQGQAVTLSNMGRICDAKGDYRAALDNYSQSLAIQEQIGDVQGQGVTLNNIGSVYKAWSQYPKALQFYEKSLFFTRKIGDAKQEAMTLNNIAAVYDDWQQYEKAMHHYEQSLEIKRRIGDVAGEAATLNNIGEVHRSWGYYAKALACYEKALELQRQIGDRSGESIDLNNMGLLYYAWGNYAQALDYYERSLAISRSIGELAAQGKTLNNMAMVFAAWGRHPEALTRFQQALAIKGSIGDVQGVGVVLHNMAHVHLAMDQHDEAIANLEKALELYKGIHVPTHAVQASIGEVYLDLGDVPKAEPYLREAGYDSSLGLLALAKADYKAAQKRYEDLLAYAKTNRNAVNLFTAYTGLGLVHESLRDYPKAEDYYRKAVEQVEEWRAGLAPSERENFFSVKTHGFRRTDPYDGLARVLAEMGRFVEALKQSEYTKARFFSEALSRRAHGPLTPIGKEAIDKESGLHDRLAALTKKLQQAVQKGDADAVAAIDGQLRQEKSKLEAHITRLREDYPLYAAAKYPQPMDLAQAAVKDDEWIIEYDVTDQGLLIYLLRGRNLVKGILKAVPAKEVEELVRRVRTPMEVVPGKDSVEDKLRSFDFDACSRLADALLGDVLQYIPQGAPVIIVPDGCLGVAPFEMLTLNRKGTVRQGTGFPLVASAEFLGDRNPISYSQSITALTLARTVNFKEPPAERVLVIADPVFEMKDRRAQEARSATRLAGVESQMYQDLMAAVEDGKVRGVRFGRLPLTGALAAALSRSFPTACRAYTGVNANKEAFLKEIAPQLNAYGIVVFATHGYAGPMLPGIQEPVLLFSLVPPGADGYLRLSEVMGLKMNADVVALTACQTGLGKELAGEGVMSMGRAFQFVGARTVLMSLWSVAEQSSVTLVEEFFRQLKDGKGKLQALESARNRIRREGYDHPFFWAAFVLVGGS